MTRPISFLTERQMTAIELDDTVVRARPA